jgi:hypothetical protein
LGQSLTVRLSQTSLLGNASTDFDNIRLTATSAVPEPQTGALAVSAIAMILIWYFFRRKRVAVVKT